MRSTSDHRIALRRLAEHLGFEVEVRDRRWRYATHDRGRKGLGRWSHPNTAWHVLATIVSIAMRRKDAPMTVTEIREVTNYNPRTIPAMPAWVEGEINRVWSRR